MPFAANVLAIREMPPPAAPAPNGEFAKSAHSSGRKSTENHENLSFVVSQTILKWNFIIFISFISCNIINSDRSLSSPSSFWHLLLKCFVFSVYYARTAFVWYFGHRAIKNRLKKIFINKRKLSAFDFKFGRINFTTGTHTFYCPHYTRYFGSLCSPARLAHSAHQSNRNMLCTISFSCTQCTH